MLWRTRLRRSKQYDESKRAPLLLATACPEHRLPMKCFASMGPVGLLVGLQERDQAGAADGDERAVDLVGAAARRTSSRSCSAAGRPAGPRATRGAEVGDEARRRRPAEAVVVGDHGGFQPACCAMSPRPAFHCAPSPLKRKKFGAWTCSVASCAPEMPSTNVLVGCCLA